MNIEDIKKAFYERLDSMSEQESLEHVLTSKPTGLIDALSTETVYEIATKTVEAKILLKNLRRSVGHYQAFTSFVDVLPDQSSALQETAEKILTITRGLSELSGLPELEIYSHKLEFQPVMFEALGGKEPHPHEHSKYESGFENTGSFFFKDGKMLSSDLGTII